MVLKLSHDSNSVQQLSQLLAIKFFLAAKHAVNGRTEKMIQSTPDAAQNFFPWL
jgi:hypothetical protein